MYICIHGRFWEHKNDKNRSFHAKVYFFCWNVDEILHTSVHTYICTYIQTAWPMKTKWSFQHSWQPTKTTFYFNFSYSYGKWSVPSWLASCCIWKWYIFLEIRPHTTTYATINYKFIKNTLLKKSQCTCITGQWKKGGVLFTPFTMTLKGVLHLLPQISMFCALFQNNQYLLEK